MIPSCHHVSNREDLVARILLYSAVPIVAKGFAAVLSSIPEFDLVAVCSNAPQLPQSVTVADPDLVIIDMDEEMSFDRLLDLRRTTSPRSRIVLWIQAITPELAYQMMRLGVRAILRKTLGAEILVKCLRKVADGECWLEETLTSSFLDIKTVRLTKRESQLVSLVSQGLKNKEISEALSIAEPTVKTYLWRLFRKVGAKDRFELALYGLRNSIAGQVQGMSQDADEPSRGKPVRKSPVLVIPDDVLFRPAVSEARVRPARSA
jgi:two-component system, NarL family, nitrate/nitrite response regulator NarL